MGLLCWAAPLHPLGPQFVDPYMPFQLLSQLTLPPFHHGCVEGQVSPLSISSSLFMEGSLVWVRNIPVGGEVRPKVHLAQGGYGTA